MLFVTFTVMVLPLFSTRVKHFSSHRPSIENEQDAQLSHIIARHATAQLQVRQQYSGAVKITDYNLEHSHE